MKLDFSNINAIVIGDLMIDNYIMGTSTRISPEAPVPVILPNNIFSKCGGAANVAMNLSSLGAKVSCVGVVGNDIWGNKLIEILSEQGINTENIDRVENFSTTLKQRIYLNNKQFVRVDNEMFLNDDCNFMKQDYSNFDLIILSDYNKGVLTKPWFRKPRNSLVLLDPKKTHVNFNECDIITPNLNELKELSGENVVTNKDIVQNCKKILNKYNLEYILAKQGDKGITIVGKENFCENIDARKVKDVDVTGAGDTVISSFGLAYALSGNILESIKFAINASALAVSKSGTATVTIDEINNYINNDG